MITTSDYRTKQHKHPTLPTSRKQSVRPAAQLCSSPVPPPPQQKKGNDTYPCCCPDTAITKNYILGKYGSVRKPISLLLMASSSQLLKNWVTSAEQTIMTPSSDTLTFLIRICVPCAAGICVPCAAGISVPCAAGICVPCAAGIMPVNRPGRKHN
jgi:hypothetical protein